MPYLLAAVSLLSLSVSPALAQQRGSAACESVVCTRPATVPKPALERTPPRREQVETLDCPLSFAISGELSSNSVKPLGLARALFRPAEAKR